MRHQLDDNAFYLKDGRRLSYARYGAQDGVPVMLFHGLPGSRIAFMIDSHILLDKKIQLIMPDRPGYGGSDPCPARTLLGWSDDVVQLADHLDLSRFHVMGGSGGGPFCLACAYALPQRVKSTTVYGCVSPMKIPGVYRGMAPLNRFAFFLSQWFPYLMKYLAAYVERSFRKDPQAILNSLTSRPCAWDQKVMSSLREHGLGDQVIAHFMEAYRQGISGKLTDGYLITADWGFSLAQIKGPVFLWHGKADTLTSMAMGQYLARAIPHCVATFVDDGGHLLLNDPDTANRMLDQIVSAYQVSNAPSLSLASA